MSKKMLKISNKLTKTVTIYCYVIIISLVKIVKTAKKTKKFF